MSEAKFDSFNTHVGALTRVMLQQCESSDDMIGAASALAFHASCVFELAGGREAAAQQFYAIADRLAAPEKEKS